MSHAYTSKIIPALWNTEALSVYYMQNPPNEKEGQDKIEKKMKWSKHFV